MGKDITSTGGDLVVPAVESGIDAHEMADEFQGDLEPARSTLARRSQRGMVSAEWAVGIVAAVAIAGVLLAVITSGQVQDALLTFILWVIKGFVSVVQ
jgi:Protein of unknown function (DUF4244)